MAIPITTFTILTIAIPLISLLGFLDKDKILAIFPFMGAIYGYIVYNYLAADGQVTVSGSNYTDYPLILIPLFLSFGMLALVAYKISPTSRIIESSFLIIGVAGIDGYFVPNVLSGLATTNDVNLPSAMLGFVQQYGEVSVIVIVLMVAVYMLYSIWK